MIAESIFERCYRLLLRAYPAHVRARFAAGMTYAVLAERDAARQGGRAALVAFLFRTIASTLWFGLSARLDRG